MVCGTTIHRPANATHAGDSCRFHFLPMNDPRTRAIIIGVIQKLCAELADAGLVLQDCETVALCDGSHQVYLSAGPLNGATPAPERLPDRATVRATSDLALTEMESAVLTTLERLSPGQTLTGAQIAVQSGYPYHAGLKSCLSVLRRRGLIENHSPGYSRVRTT